MTDRQRLAEQQRVETKIMQKVNAAHRESFAAKFPGQLEHILRLTAERLQAGLDKRDGVDITRPETWRLNTAEIAELSEAMYYITLIRDNLKEKNNAISDTSGR
jgi:hypothetical protein